MKYRLRIKKHTQELICTIQYINTSLFLKNHQFLEDSRVHVSGDLNQSVLPNIIDKHIPYVFRSIDHLSETFGAK